jgi:hypothetical protein
LVASIGVPGAPRLLTFLMRLPSTTMSTGPTGGAPVPSTSVAPRRISRFHGPSPSIETIPHLLSSKRSHFCVSIPFFSTPSVLKYQLRRTRTTSLSRTANSRAALVPW